MAAHDGITPGLECDNAATLAGYTREVIATSAMQDVHLLILPDTDLDGCFTCKGTGSVPSAEEYAVHDSEDLPAGFRDTEHPDLKALIERLEELEELEDSEREVYDAFCDYDSTDATVDRFRDAYIGEFGDWSDVAEHYAEETGMLDAMPENLRCYFDFDKYGHALSFDGFESNGHFFWSR